MKKDRNISERERKYALAYAILGSQKKAALYAGYSVNSIRAVSSKLLKRDRVKIQIDIYTSRMTLLKNSLIEISNLSTGRYSDNLIVEIFEIISKHD